MQLTKNKVAILNYTLKDKDGNILGQHNDGSFTYLHGAKNLIPALENALEGNQAGDKVDAIIEPEDAYGVHDPKKIQRVPKKTFPPEQELKIGMHFKSAMPDGTAMNVLITEIETDEIVVDGNHPLASKQLHFDIDILEIRDATEEELEHGHVHGPGGHHH